MPEASDGGDPSTTTTLVPNQLASLVPTFDPVKDEILEYTKKVQLLMNMWPEGKWIEQIPIPHHGFRYVFHPTLDHDPWKRLPTLDEPKKRFFLEVNDSTLAPSDTDVQ